MTIINYNDMNNLYTVVDNRVVSGDLKGTIEGNEFHVDQSDDWMFDWERHDPNCYARRMQAKKVLRLVR